jgi:AcrR family transcriptional regulator
LLDAAEQVFASRGFEGASLDEIADTAGYTRGAIYKHFTSKEDLFMGVNRRLNERFLTGFLDLVEPAAAPDAVDLAQIAKRWHELQTQAPHAVGLGAEFSLYVLRNPHVRARVAEQKREVAQMIATFMDEQAALLGVKLRIPAFTLARIVLACGDGLELAGHLDEGEDDLYEPFLELLISAWDSTPTPAEPPAPPRRRPTKKKPAAPKR